MTHLSRQLDRDCLESKHDIVHLVLIICDMQDVWVRLVCPTLLLTHQHCRGAHQEEDINVFRRACSRWVHHNHPTSLLSEQFPHVPQCYGQTPCISTCSMCVNLPYLILRFRLLSQLHLFRRHIHIPVNTYTRYILLWDLCGTFDLILSQQ